MVTNSDRLETNSENMLRLIALTLLAAFVSGQSTQVSRCIHHAGDLPTNTNIVGCTRPPCVLPQLQNAIMHLTFRAPRNIRSMRTLATAYLRVGGITIPVPHDLGPNAVTCNFLTNTRCPLRAGETVNYTLRMFIESFFPVGTSVDIELRVVDENNAPVLCFRTSLRIAAPRNAVQELDSN